MIQRIQTIYLLVAGALSLCAVFMPLAYFSTVGGELFDLHASGLYTAMGESIQGTAYLMVLVIAAAILPFVTIFLFNNRMLQLRFCVVECVLLIGTYAMIAAYFYLSARAFGEIGVDSKGFHPALFAPLGAIFAAVMAARAIFKDVLLLRSVDRIR